MDDPILTPEERESINTGRWFSTLSPTLRHDILRCAYVKRFKDGALIFSRGDEPEEWVSVAKGSARVSSASLTGKQITLTYVEPGTWFGDVGLFDDDSRTHDVYAHGETTLVCVSKADFQRILPLAVAYCAGYAGLDTSQELPDEIGYAILVVAAEMYDNRQMTQQYSAQNATVRQILDMHSTNLLPSVEGDV